MCYVLLWFWRFFLWVGWFFIRVVMQPELEKSSKIFIHFSQLLRSNLLPFWLKSHRMIMKLNRIALFMSIKWNLRQCNRRSVLWKFSVFAHFPIFHCQSSQNFIRTMFSCWCCTCSQQFTCCNCCPLADLRRDEVNLKAIFFTFCSARSLIQNY